MKKLLILLTIISLYSCSTTKNNNDQSVIQETKQIISDYPDTLETSIKNAKEVKNQYNQKVDELGKSIQNAKIK
ncbi:MAG: hypothetical protein PHN31_00100 [Candidatus Gracilibacteria bacterium]|nr:hypothetical protein [Candidatus Gracilibacteria bacterium]